MATGSGVRNVLEDVEDGENEAEVVLLHDFEVLHEPGADKVVEVGGRNGVLRGVADRLGIREGAPLGGVRVELGPPLVDLLQPDLLAVLDPRGQGVRPALRFVVGQLGVPAGHDVGFSFFSSGTFLVLKFTIEGNRTFLGTYLEGGDPPLTSWREKVVV